MSQLGAAVTALKVETISHWNERRAISQSKSHLRLRLIALAARDLAASTCRNDLLVLFFGAGALICLVTMFALAFPGGVLEPIWRLKPEARLEFQELGRWSIALMAVVGAACGLAAIGLAQNAEWGRRLALGVLTVNLIGDSLNALLRHDPWTLIGLPIGGLMIWYLLRRRASF